MRNLASIVTVETKNKMFEKDRICVVTFKELGYEAIVPIEVNIGDKLVFIQEGSILPEVDRWEFLRKRCYKSDLKGFLIKPMLMGAKDDNGQKGEKVKSWGLCVTLTEAGLTEDLKAGTDVTDKLEIRKYEPEEDALLKQLKVPKFIKLCMQHKFTRWIGKIWFKLHKKQSGNFPTDIISKSDETTIQNCKGVINDFTGKKAFITAKMEGQSFTCSLDLKHKNKFYVCSRNNRYNDPDSSNKFFEAAEFYDIANRLKVYQKKTGIYLMLQGEQCGPGIQNNIYNFKQLTWFLFRMKGFENNTWVEYNYPKMKEIADELGIPCVPLLEIVEDMSIYNSIDKLVTRAEKAYWTNETFDYKPTEKDQLWKTYCQHEGIVVKSEDYNKELGIGFSFKVKNLAYAERGLSDIAKVFKNN